MNVILPSNIEELWDVMNNDGDTAICAGGTDILVKIRTGMVRPSTLICLERLEGLYGIQDEGETVFIGACATHADILASPVVTTFLPVLGKAIRVLGSPPIRNMATLGGNICTASPAGDTLPALYVLGAELELWSQKGKRIVPIDQFIIGPGKTLIQHGEILAGVRMRKSLDFPIQHFEKVGQRRAMSISIASLAALVRLDKTYRIEEICLAWGSVGPTIVRSKEVETALVGMELSVENLQSVFPRIEKVVSPISDVRASVSYRKIVSANLLLRLAVKSDCQHG